MMGESETEGCQKLQFEGTGIVSSDAVEAVPGIEIKIEFEEDSTRSQQSPIEVKENNSDRKESSWARQMNRVTHSEDDVRGDRNRLVPIPIEILDSTDEEEEPTKEEIVTRQDDAADEFRTKSTTVPEVGELFSAESCASTSKLDSIAPPMREITGEMYGSLVTVTPEGKQSTVKNIHSAEEPKLGNPPDSMCVLGTKAGIASSGNESKADDESSGHLPTAPITVDSNNSKESLPVMDETPVEVSRDGEVVFEGKNSGEDNVGSEQNIAVEPVSNADAIIRNVVTKLQEELAEQIAHFGWKLEENHLVQTDVSESVKGGGDASVGISSDADSKKPKIQSREPVFGESEIANVSPQSPSSSSASGCDLKATSSLSSSGAHVAVGHAEASASLACPEVESANMKEPSVSDDESFASFPKSTGSPPVGDVRVRRREVDSISSYESLENNSECAGVMEEAVAVASIPVEVELEIQTDRTAGERKRENKNRKKKAKDRNRRKREEDGRVPLGAGEASGFRDQRNENPHDVTRHRGGNASDQGGSTEHPGRRRVYAADSRYQLRLYKCGCDREWMMVSNGREVNCKGCKNPVSPWKDPKLEFISSQQRVHGFFCCPEENCGWDWQTSRSYVGYPQKCPKCDTITFAFKQETYRPRWM